MRIIFVSGKYRDKDWDAIECNIRKAEKASIKLWQLGWAVICPHLNTAHFDGYCEDTVWLQGDLAMIDRFDPTRDVLFMLDNWKESTGAGNEREHAQRRGIKIYYEEMGYPTPSGGIIKQHHCKDFFWLKNELNRERLCSKCGFIQNIDTPLTADSRSFARIK